MPGTPVIVVGGSPRKRRKKNRVGNNSSTISPKKSLDMMEVDNPPAHNAYETDGAGNDADVEESSDDDSSEDEGAKRRVTRAVFRSIINDNDMHEEDNIQTPIIENEQLQPPDPTNPLMGMLQNNSNLSNTNSTAGNNPNKYLGENSEGRATSFSIPGVSNVAHAQSALNRSVDVDTMTPVRNSVLDALTDAESCIKLLKVSERSERALRKTRILAMDLAKWLQT